MALKICEQNDKLAVIQILEHHYEKHPLRSIFDIFTFIHPFGLWIYARGVMVTEVSVV